MVLRQISSGQTRHNGHQETELRSQQPKWNCTDNAKITGAARAAFVNCPPCFSMADSSGFCLLPLGLSDMQYSHSPCLAQGKCASAPCPERRLFFRRRHGQFVRNLRRAGSARLFAARQSFSGFRAMLFRIARIRLSMRPSIGPPPLRRCGGNTRLFRYRFVPPFSELSHKRAGPATVLPLLLRQAGVRM